jgi:methionyl-tRNA synthetase
MALADFGNIFFQSNEPWKLVRGDKKKAESVLRNCLQIAKALVILMEPIMPDKMQNAWVQLGQPGLVKDTRFEDALSDLGEGQQLGTPAILFARIDDDQVKSLDKIFKDRISQAEGKKDEISDEKKKEISFEEFQALDIRIGEIISAEGIKGSNKLLKLNVDIGKEIRQVVAGIAQNYSIADLVGTQVVVLTNLKPTRIFGVDSKAMLLAADENGKAVLLQPKGKTKSGTKVR